MYYNILFILLFHANLVRTTVFQRSHNHLRFCCAVTLMTQNHCGVSDSATVNDFVSKLLITNEPLIFNTRVLPPVVSGATCVYVCLACVAVQQRAYKGGGV